MIQRDSDLINPDDILDRIGSIESQREKLCSISCRSNHHLDFEKKQNRIAKLTEREGKLRRLLWRQKQIL